MPVDKNYWLDRTQWWAYRNKQTIADRDRCMVNAQEAGATLAQIGRAAGIGRSGVHAAIKRAKEKRA